MRQRNPKLPAPTPEFIAAAEARAAWRVQVGHVLRSIREAKGVTQSAWARAAGILPPGWNAVEQGNRDLPPAWLDLLAGAEVDPKTGQAVPGLTRGERAALEAVLNQRPEVVR